MQALRGSVIDVVIEVGQAWRVLSYSNTLTQEFVDRLNNSGFRVLNVDDGNLAILTGGTLRVRVEVLSDGYGSEQDAASVVSGAASAIGYNATGFVGSLVSSGGGANNNTQPGGWSGQSYDIYDPNANKPPSLAGLFGFGGGDVSVLLFGALAVVTVIVIARR